MLKKLLMAFAALFLILVGGLILTMGYVFNHPNSIMNAFHSLTNKITQGESYEENEEYFLQGIKNLRIKSKSANVQVLPYSGSTLKVQLQGKIPRFERGPFLVQNHGPDNDATNLVVEIHEPLASSWVHININGHETNAVSDSSLTAKVYLPKSFLNPVSVENFEGTVEVQIPKDKFYELDLQSESGKINNQVMGIHPEGLNPSEVGKLRISTTSGNISIKQMD